MAKTYFSAGQWNAICQSCGQKFKSSELRRRWDGLIVCANDFEYRHPQDFVRARIDKQVPPWTSPRPGDVFVEVLYIFDYVTGGYMTSDYVQAGDSI